MRCARLGGECEVEVDQFTNAGHDLFTGLFNLLNKPLVLAIGCVHQIYARELQTSSMIVREIIERDPTSEPPAPPKPPAPSSQKQGFPAPRRRVIKAGPSRFAQSAQGSPSGHAGPSNPNPSLTMRDGEQFPHLDFAQPFHDRLSQSSELQRQMEEENNARVQSMTEEERDQEKEELLARFGGGLVGLMRKRKEQREKENARATAAGELNVTSQASPLTPRISGQCSI
jgi:hypothetical protein